MVAGGLVLAVVTALRRGLTGAPPPDGRTTIGLMVDYAAATAGASTLLAALAGALEALRRMGPPRSPWRIAAADAALALPAAGIAILLLTEGPGAGPSVRRMALRLAAAGAMAVLLATGFRLVRGGALRHRPAAFALLAAAFAALVLDVRGFRLRYPALDAMAALAALGLFALALPPLLPRFRILRIAGAAAAAAAVAHCILSPPPPPAAADMRINGSAAFFATRIFGAILPTWPGGADPPEILAATPGLFDPPPHSAAGMARRDEILGTAAGRSVILVTVDALRADRIEDPDRAEVAPRLRELAAASTAFLAHRSQASETAFSMASMLTARYPSETPRVHEDLTGRAPEGPVRPLAAILVEAGFTTLAVTGMSGREIADHRFESFFEGFGTVIREEKGLSAASVVDRALGAVRAAGRQRVFLWLHLFDPHAPYTPAEAPPGASAEALYDAEVRETDRALGGLLDGLQSLGRLDDSVLAIHSDHGEAFGEHGAWYHGTSFFDEQIRVPLILRVPGLPPARIRRPTGNVDIAPTLLELAGLPIPAWMHGVSLVPVLLDPEIAFPRAAFAESPRSRGLRDALSDDCRVIVDGRFKLFHYQADAAFVLHDLAADPGERRDVAASHPEEVARLRGGLAALDARLRAGSAALAASADRELHRRLHDLLGSDPEAKARALAFLATPGHAALAPRLRARLRGLDAGARIAALYLLEIWAAPGSLADLEEALSATDGERFMALRLASTIDPEGAAALAASRRERSPSVEWLRRLVAGDPPGDDPGSLLSPDGTIRTIAARALAPRQRGAAVAALRFELARSDIRSGRFVAMARRLLALSPGDGLDGICARIVREGLIAESARADLADAAASIGGGEADELLILLLPGATPPVAGRIRASLERRVDPQILDAAMRLAEELLAGRAGERETLADLPFPRLLALARTGGPRSSVVLERITAGPPVAGTARFLIAMRPERGGRAPDSIEAAWETGGGGRTSIAIPLPFVLVPDGGTLTIVAELRLPPGDDAVRLCAAGAGSDWIHPPHTPGRRRSGREILAAGGVSGALATASATAGGICALLPVLGPAVVTLDLPPDLEGSAVVRIRGAFDRNAEAREVRASILSREGVPRRAGSAMAGTDMISIPLSDCTPGERVVLDFGATPGLVEIESVEFAEAR